MPFEHVGLIAMPLWAKRRAVVIFRRLVTAGCPIDRAADVAVARVSVSLRRIARTN